MNGWHGLVRLLDVSYVVSNLLADMIIAPFSAPVAFSSSLRLTTGDVGGRGPTYFCFMKKIGVDSGGRGGTLGGRGALGASAVPCRCSTAHHWD